MLNRKNAKRYNHNRRKASVLLTSLVVLLCLSVASTVAYLVVTGNSIVNIFRPTSVTPSVEETFDRSEKSNVYLTNTGTTDAYIRAAIVVTWQDEAGGVYAGQPVKDVDYTIDLELEDWIKGDDGFYYYTKPVAPQGTTAILIDSCAPVDEKTPAGYGLNVEILGSAIQSVPAAAAEEAWGVAVAEDGTIRMSGGAGE